MTSHCNYNPGFKIPGGVKNEPLNMSEFDRVVLQCGGFVYYPKVKHGN